jgi:hypothetical protein
MGIITGEVDLEEFVLGDISEHTLKALFEKACLNGSADDKTVIVMDVLCDIPF